MAKKYITKTSKDYSLMDNHTGELLEYKQTIKVDVSNFIMIYFASFPELMELTGQKLKVLMVCWLLADFGTSERGSEVVNDAKFKDKVREYEPTLSDKNIDACFTEFVKRRIVTRVCRGRYRLNPVYSFKGSITDRTHAILAVEVDPKTKFEKKSADGKSAVCFFAKSLFMYERTAMEE